ISLFLAGMLVRLSPRSISPPWWCVVVAWAVFPLARELEITYPLILLAVFLTSFAIAFRTPAVLHHPTGSFDLSYGIYIYAYPAQQLLAQAGVRSPLVMLLASVAILVPLGLASQLLLERPALRLKPRRPPPPALEVTDTGENRAATA
ncbi:MAG: hypothetical protein ABIS86_03265, partial [Streptosporangiaceae bacterium]